MLVILIHTQTNVILSKQDKMMMDELNLKKVRLDSDVLHFWKMSVDLPLLGSLAKKNHIYSCQLRYKLKGILNIGTNSRRKTMQTFGRHR